MVSASSGGARRSTARAEARLIARVAVEPLEGRTLLSVTTYDAAAQFSTTANPNGVWSYGSLSPTLTPAATFTPFAHEGQTLAPNLTAWQDGTAGTPPAVGENLSGSQIDQGTLHVPTGVLYMHPASDGRFADARFTAPVAGTATVTFAFTGIDAHPTTTDVHVAHDGTAFADGQINGGTGGNTFGSTASFVVAAGDTVDFLVGYGANKTFDFDSTSLSATISVDTSVTTPPSTLAPSGVASTVPAAVVFGGKSKGIVKGTLTATAATTGAASVVLYATADGVATDGVPLVTLNRKVKLKAGKKQPFALSVKSIPAALAAGSYTLVVRSTDPAGGVTDAAAGPLTVSPATVVLSTSTLADAKPSTVKAGRTTAAVLTLTNTGNSDAVGTLIVTFVPSTTGATTGAAADLQTLTRKVTIRAGRSVKVPLVAKVPASLAAGSYTVAADVAVAGTVVGTVTTSLATAGPFTVA